MEEEGEETRERLSLQEWKQKSTTRRISRQPLFSICWDTKQCAYLLNLSEYFDVEDIFQKPVDTHK